MRQLTLKKKEPVNRLFSKLPMRQLTTLKMTPNSYSISKLPMRQLTRIIRIDETTFISKLPMRQLTMPERKKNPTARALIHLFPTLTQIYSCFEIY